jgi:hypothetical protein
MEFVLTLKLICKVNANRDLFIKMRFSSELASNDPTLDPRSVKNSDTTPASGLVEVPVNQYIEIERHTLACRKSATPRERTQGEMIFNQ